MFKAYGIGGNRCCTPFTIRDDEGNVVFEGKTKDESFDGNDHTTVPLPIGASFELVFGTGAKQTITTKSTDSNSQLFAFAVTESGDEASAGEGSAESSASTAAPAGRPTPVAQLSQYLSSDAFDWNQIAEQPFANAPLTRNDASRARDLLVQKRREQLLKERKAEVEALEIKLGDRTMPFFYKVFGDKPEGGRSLYISMHGGGNAPARVNDRQWNNQKRLYEPAEGVYVAPRAPTNTWNLWHEGHIMPMFDRLIEDMILFEDVNPNRVYIMGYSAGGDGVYQLAPRMADRLAAAAMMAGHPQRRPAAKPAQHRIRPVHGRQRQGLQTKRSRGRVGPKACQTAGAGSGRLSSSGNDLSGQRPLDGPTGRFVSTVDGRVPAKPAAIQSCLAKGRQPPGAVLLVGSRCRSLDRWRGGNSQPGRAGDSL